MDTHSQLIGSEGLASLGMDLATFADGLPGGFFIYEAHDEERILFANAQMARIFGCEDTDEFLEMVGGSFPGMVYHEDLQRVENSMWSQNNSQQEKNVAHRGHVTYRIVDKQGTMHYMDEYGRLVRSTDLGDLFFVFVNDIAAVDQVPTPSTKGSGPGQHADGPEKIDALTGLRSMRYYHSHARKVLARATAVGIPMVDVFFDVDHFRTVNYRLGYEVGDEVLQRIATILRNCFEGDLLARFSDDHFVLVTRREGVERRIERAHELVSKLLPDMPIELKAGIYELAENEVSIPFAHDRAKAACTSTKGRYDLFYRFYDKPLAAGEKMHEYIVHHIEQAIEQGWIRNYYQPVVWVEDQTCCGIEALSRWFDPVEGMLPPSQYVDLLEETRLIHLLDRAVVERACADVRQMMRELGTAVPVSLNFSPRDLSLVDIPSLLEESVRRHDIPHELVHVEITESSLAEDRDLLRQVIHQLHDLGFGVWMDDFGSGYSSLNLLKDYDFDVLKVDLEFLRGMEGNERSKTIMHAIIDLAHDLGMTTLVEGVETPDQMAFLRKVGADRAQGYLFSKPIPYESVVGDFLRRFPPKQSEPREG